MLSQQVAGRRDLRGVERAARHGVLVPVLDALHAPPAGPLDLHAQLDGEGLVLQPPDDRGAVERPCERARAPVSIFKKRNVSWLPVISPRSVDPSTAPAPPPPSPLVLIGHAASLTPY